MTPPEGSNTTHYTYDAAGRILKEEAPGKTTVYAYDDAGNRVSLNEAYASSQPTGFIDEARGSEVEYISKKSQYVYSAANRLLKLVEEMYDQTGKKVLTKNIRYIYDSNGNELVRYASYVHPNNAALRRTIKGGVYGNSQSSGPNPLIERTVNSYDGFNRLKKAEKIQGGVRTLVDYTYNGHGDVVQTVLSDGTVRNQYDYDIFGNPTLTMEYEQCSIRYAGEYLDNETGLYYLRARYYDPYTGRFISEDSYWGEDINPLSLNLYTYCFNNPIKYIDPTGHMTEEQRQIEIERKIAQLDALKRIWAEEEKGAGKGTQVMTDKQKKAAQEGKGVRAKLLELEQDEELEGLIKSDQQGIAGAWEEYKAEKKAEKIKADNYKLKDSDVTELYQLKIDAEISKAMGKGIYGIDINDVSASIMTRAEKAAREFTIGAVQYVFDRTVPDSLDSESITEKYVDRVIRDYISAQGTGNSNLKANGQDKNFSGYGGIEDLTKYVNSEYGSGWTESAAASISGIDNFTQAELEKDANNCTLASITRIMKYYSDMGYTDIPSDIKEIYKKVREIGEKHGYDPKKTGVLRDLFIYTPWEIDNMVQDTWKAFGYSKGDGDNDYFGKLGTIKSNIDNSDPLLLNITFGDYEGHTVSVIGYKVFSKKGEKDKAFVQIYDGWSDTVRYIDWTKFGNTPASVTRFLPPSKK